ncbi:MAG: Crp/Fnr family transcriptional regulator [Planctomycetes bacterium]|nr:Crp/Fnr family transcriptional regulator [Planctomycetota bacterium]
MSEAGLDVALRALPHFKAVPADLVAQVASMSRFVRLDVGAIVFREGDPCRQFYAIVNGAVKLYRVSADGREQVVHNFHAGATFAEAALLSFGRFPVSAMVTESSTVLLEIGGERFVELLRTDARLAPAVIGSLCMRLAQLVERVDELSLVQAGARLARWLLRQPARGTSEPAVELGLAKKELAAHLAMTPETLSRLLSRWESEGWIRNERTRVALRDGPALLRLADGESGPT